MESAMKRITALQIIFIFQYILERSFGQDGISNHYSFHIGTSTYYEDDVHFLDAFNKKFPGKKEDPNLIRTSRRVYRLLTYLYIYGYIHRWRVSNHDRSVPQEPKWQNSYRLRQKVINDFKNGTTTPVKLVEKWSGLSLEEGK
jgi:hypothetical protein